MAIDPKLAMYLNIAALVLSVFAAASWWGDLISPHTAATLTGIMNTVVSATNVVLHAYSSRDSGPLTKG